MPFKNCNVLITGTTRGLGCELAKYFTNNGYKVIGCSSSSASVIEAPNYSHYTFDLRDFNETNAAIRKIALTHGGLDGLVNNVGLVKGKLLGVMYTDKTYLEYVNAIQLTTLNSCVAASKVMMKRRQGSIVNISSIMTHVHSEGTLGYSSSKAAVEEMTRLLAREFLSFGILVNSISPSYIETESTKSLGDAWLEKMYEMQDIKRPVDTTSFSKLVEYFLFNNTHITGQNIKFGVI